MSCRHSGQKPRRRVATTLPPTVCYERRIDDIDYIHSILDHIVRGGAGA